MIDGCRLLLRSLVFWLLAKPPPGRVRVPFSSGWRRRRRTGEGELVVVAEDIALTRVRVWCRTRLVKRVACAIAPIDRCVCSSIREEVCWVDAGCWTDYATQVTYKLSSLNIRALGEIRSR